MADRRESAITNSPPTTLVLGVGNPLRGDDAAGWRVAEAIEALHLPGVEVRCTQQLQVEHSQMLPDYQKVIVVDASVHGPPLTLRAIEPAETPAAANSHALDPWALQALTRMTRGPCPPMLLCTLRAESLDLGTTLTPQMAERVRHAISAIREVLEHSCPPLSCGNLGQDSRHSNFPIPVETRPPPAVS